MGPTLVDLFAAKASCKRWSDADLARSPALHRETAMSVAQFYLGLEQAVLVKNEPMSWPASNRSVPPTLSLPRITSKKPPTPASETTSSVTLPESAQRLGPDTPPTPP